MTTAHRFRPGDVGVQSDTDVRHARDDVDSRKRPALGAIAEGIRYQLGFFWREAIRLLYDSTVDHVELESPDAGAVDDVVVRYAAPGRVDAGRRVSVDYYQLKFHVGAGALTSASLLDRPAGRPSLLQKFGGAWRLLRDDSADLRMSLVTNWSWSRADALVKHLEHDGSIRGSFLTCSTRSAAGKIRVSWQTEVGLAGDEFRRFCSALRLDGSGVSQSRSDEWLRDRCELAGLQIDDPTRESSTLLSLGLKLLGTGRTRLDRARLDALMTTEGLYRSPELPFRSTLAVRSFLRNALDPPPDGAVRVDLAELVAPDRGVSGDAWSLEIPRHLERPVEEAARLPQPVRLAFDTHLSIAWYIGTLLPSKAGVSFVLLQKTLEGTTLWDGTGSTGECWRTRREDIGPGQDIVVAFSTKHAIVEDVRACVAARRIHAGTLFSLELGNGGDLAVRSGRHALDLADAAIAEIRKASRDFRGRIHLFMACPWALAFLFGQRFHVLGETTAYEYALGSARSYEPTLNNHKSRS